MRDTTIERGQAWKDLGALLWRYRSRLTLGLFLVIVNRLSAIALPLSCKFVIDTVVGDARADLPAGCLHGPLESRHGSHRVRG
jgi:hypothetical protein